jgi:hypothetical protein
VGRQPPPTSRSEPSREIAWATDQQASVGMASQIARASAIDRTDRAPAPPIPSVGATIAGEHSPPVRHLDTELPIVQSIEPAPGTNGRRASAVVPPLPMIVDQVRRTTERVSGEVRAIAERRPRTTLLIAVATFVLLGVAIGYASARGIDRPTTGEAGGQLDDARVPAAVPGADSLQRGSVLRDSSPRRGAVASPRRPSANVRRRARGSRSAPAVPLLPPSDTTAVRAAAPVASGDSAARAAVLDAARARSDSVATERDALRLELERRRARLDSIARRVQELKPRR